MNQNSQYQEHGKDRDPYDFSGPLWEKYHKEVRSRARFPRGYKEVTIYS
ncbi:hypothetical protein [Sanyastnella coralliicola]|nr:hypothetical protein [Longitalea sp. SCSIO 12813]